MINYRQCAPDHDVNRNEASVNLIDQILQHLRHKCRLLKSTKSRELTQKIYLTRILPLTWYYTRFITRNIDLLSINTHISLRVKQQYMGISDSSYDL